MAGRRAWWTGRVFSYGTKYQDGKPSGFKIAVCLNDGTDKPRYAELSLSDGTARNLRVALAAHLDRPPVAVESCACGSTTPARCTERCERDDL